MAEIKRTVDDNEKNLSGIYHRTLKILSEKLLQEKCLIFLGAGASKDSNKPDLPSAEELSEEMAKECGLKWHKFILYQL